MTRKNSECSMSAMDKHRSKMKDRRSVDRQKQTGNASLNILVSKNEKLNDDINQVLG